ncbi:MAG: SLC13 family permease [Candidatus Thermoplasmatota archaeon]|nr:SLC13/DASS family transporter [Euryarchaeota archaeon]MBU4031746.1 SLC13 family permease [Candidatus Thermoplasmatota archaeon]MBU4071062.1 SLC13 family permease [Candidatus Thermoplasmatota archaeon]MBU4143813.1 SLC13 family permease [Candidatus Thermoplasmatota archaeon]MBU4591598.1 SLC13 family permease [Candidatus Thermoplasmatota archaeon]
MDPKEELKHLAEKPKEIAREAYFSLIYNVKPSFFNFLNKLSDIVRNSLKILLAIIGFLIMAFLPLELDYHAQMALAIFVGIAIMWTTEAIPLPVTALLVPVLLTAFGIFGTSDALIPFAHPVVYLLLGGVILAGAVHKTGMDKRMLYPFLIRSGGKPDRLLLYMMLFSGLLSMWISNTATVALLAPFAISLGASIEDKESSKRLTKMLLLGIGFSAVIGGLGTVIGSSPNAVASAILAEQGAWTFLDWMIIGMPTAFVLLFLTWRIILWVIPVPEVTVNVDILKDDYSKMGPLSGAEKKTLAIFSLTVMFWISGTTLGQFIGFNSSFMSAAIIGLLAAVALFATGVMKWEDASNVPWGVFLIIGAGLALGEAIVYTGAADWITAQLFSLVYGLPLLAIVLVIGFIIVTISNFLNNTASAAIFIPILIALASSMDVNIRLLVLPVALILSLSFITPIGTPPITLMYSLGKVTRVELAKIGILITIPAVFICVFMVYLLNYLGLI